MRQLPREGDKAASVPRALRSCTRAGVGARGRLLAPVVKSALAEWSLVSLAASALLAGVVVVPAFAYRLPPEKVLQYWLGQRLRYGDFRVRLEHTRYDAGGATPSVTPVGILFSEESGFRLQSPAAEGSGKAADESFVVIGSAGELVGVAGDAVLSPETVGRYAFWRLFSPGTGLTSEQLARLDAAHVVIRSPSVLWMLVWLEQCGIDWQETRLAPTPGGEVGYVLGVSYREGPWTESGLSTDRPVLWMHHTEFVPLEMRWTQKLEGDREIPYRVVFDGYGNDILRKFPRRVAVFVGDRLAEEFTLLSATQPVPIAPGELDVAALREKTLRKREEAESGPDSEAPAPGAGAAPAPSGEAERP